MSLSHDVNTACYNASVESSPTSPKLSQDFSSLRVVSEDSMSPGHQASTTATTKRTTVSPLEALAQLCAAEKDNDQTSPASTPTSETESSLPKPGDAAFKISQNDVLCGRGGLTNHHPGNVFFRQLVRIKQESYLLASKREKAGVAREIVDLIRKLQPSGRFLKKDPKNPSVWIEIGDRKAREKTSQALREGAPELREDLQQQQQHQQQLQVPDVNSMNHRGHAHTSRRLLHTEPHQNSRVWNPEESSTSLVTHSTSSAEMTIMPSNRARIVSDDSVGLGYNQFLQDHQPPPPQQQPHLVVDQLPERQSSLYSGSKRSRDEQAPCAMQVDRDQERATANRGPRLKLFKSRMEYCR